MTKKIWIDTDCGVDDALAIICACKLPDLEILGMSSGVGTTTLENTFRNTRNVLHLLKRDDIKVYKGAESSWIRPYAPAPAFHGENGLGNVALADSPVPIEEKPAWDALYETAVNNGPLTIVTIGQLTNLANTIIKYPDFGDHVDQVLIMGGSIVGGNTTMAAEANIYRDPQAAQCVLKSGLKIVLFPLDVTTKVYLSRQDQEELFAYDNPLAAFAGKATAIALETNRKNYNYDNYDLHDLCPVLYLDYPEYFSGKKGAVYVESREGICCGKTVSDIYTLMDKRLKDNEVEIMLEAEREKLVLIVKDIFANG